MFEDKCFIRAARTCVVPHVIIEAEHPAFKQNLKRLQLHRHIARGVFHGNAQRTIPDTRFAHIPESADLFKVLFFVLLDDKHLFVRQCEIGAPGKVHVDDGDMQSLCRVDGIQHGIAIGLCHPAVKIAHVHVVIQMQGKPHAVFPGKGGVFRFVQMMIEGKIGVQFHKIKAQLTARGAVFLRRCKFDQRRHTKAHTARLPSLLLCH